MKISTLSGFTKTSYIPCLVKIRYKEGWGGGGGTSHMIERVGLRVGNFELHVNP